MGIKFAKLNFDRKTEVEMIKKLDRLGDDYKWIEENRQKLFRLYPNLCIAVKDKKVDYVEKSMAGLVFMIKKEGLEPTDFAMERVTKEKPKLLLSAR